VNILLTGEPRVGKTSLLQHWLAKQQNTYGFLTIEVRREHNRMGLACVASDGIRAHCADVDIESTTRIGRYGIDIPKLDGFFTNLEKLPKSAELLYLDEIGQMQLLIGSFPSLSTQWLDDPRPLIGTISAIFEHPYIQQVQARPDTIICHVTAASKDVLPAVLDTIEIYTAHEHDLNEEVKRNVQSMAKQYAANHKYIYLKKLLGSAVPYIAQQRIKPTAIDTWIIAGNHGIHKVKTTNGKAQCKCDLFNGRGKYAGLGGDCSHLQTVKLAFNLTAV